MTDNKWLNDIRDNVLLSNYNNIKDIKKGDRVYIKDFGKGTIKDIVDNEILFDSDKTNDTNIFIASTLVSNNFIKKIEEEGNDEEMEVQQEDGLFDRNKNQVNSKPFDKSILKTHFDKNINVNPSNIKMNDIIEEEEEEDSEEENIFDLLYSLTKDELSGIEITEFFTEEEIDMMLSYDELNDIENDIKENIEELKNTNLIKYRIYQTKLKNIENIKKYYSFLSKKFNSYKIYHFSGRIPYEELWNLRYKERMSDIDFKYKRNEGLILYWVFKDNIIFKTI
jgi:hypothetical protein